MYDDVLSLYHGRGKRIERNFRNLFVTESSLFMGAVHEKVSCIFLYFFREKERRNENE